MLFLLNDERNILCQSYKPLRLKHPKHIFINIDYFKH